MTGVGGAAFFSKFNEPRVGMSAVRRNLRERHQLKNTNRSRGNEGKSNRLLIPDNHFASKESGFDRLNQVSGRTDYPRPGTIFPPIDCIL